MRPGCSVPNAIHWRHPSKYPSTTLGSHADTMQVARDDSREAAPLEWQRSVTGKSYVYPELRR